MSVLIATEKIYLRRGEADREVFEYRQENGEPYNLTGKTAEFRLLFGDQETVLDANSLNGSALVTTPLGGIITVSVSQALIDSLTADARGRYVLSLVEPNGERNRILQGELILKGFYEF